MLGLALSCCCYSAYHAKIFKLVCVSQEEIENFSFFFTYGNAFTISYVLS